MPRTMQARSKAAWSALPRMATSLPTCLDIRRTASSRAGMRPSVSGLITFKRSTSLRLWMAGSTMRPGSLGAHSERAPIASASIVVSVSTRMQSWPYFSTAWRCTRAMASGLTRYSSMRTPASRVASIKLCRPRAHDRGFPPPEPSAPAQESSWNENLQA